jgi:hypothetical protein
MALFSFASKSTSYSFDFFMGRISNSDSPLNYNIVSPVLSEVQPRELAPL